MDSLDPVVLIPRPAARLAVLTLPLALAACGGSSSTDTAAVLPDGPEDPRAYTEADLSRNPGAVLRPALMAILPLEPTAGGEDTGAADGVDVLTYHLDAAIELGLAIDPSAAHGGALVLRIFATSISRGRASSAPPWKASISPALPSPAPT